MPRSTFSYWQKLGIDCFVPRHRLRGTAQHSVYQRKQLGASVSKPAPVKNIPNTAPPWRNADRTPVHNASVLPKNQSKAVKAPKVHFEVLLFFIDKTVCIDIAPQPPRQYREKDWLSLVLNILRLCTPRMPEDTKTPRPFHKLAWPPSDTMLLSQEPLRAHEYVRKELDTRLKTADRALVFGGRADELILTWIKESVAHIGTKHFCTYSVVEALTKAQIKASIWDELRAQSKLPEHWF